MKKTKPKGPTKADLKRQIAELNAQMASTYHFAAAGLHKAGDAMMGSGVMIQLTGLGGKEIINPVVIRDGLSQDTIDAIRKDILRSYELATMLKPKAS